MQVHPRGPHIRGPLASSAGCAGAWLGKHPALLRLWWPRSQELLAVPCLWPRVVLGTAPATGPAMAPAVALLSQQRRVATHSMALVSGRCCPMSGPSQREALRSEGRGRFYFGCRWPPLRAPGPCTAGQHSWHCWMGRRPPRACTGKLHPIHWPGQAGAGGGGRGGGLAWVWRGTRDLGRRQGTGWPSQVWWKLVSTPRGV